MKNAIKKHYQKCLAIILAIALSGCMQGCAMVKQTRVSGSVESTKTTHRITNYEYPRTGDSN